VENLTVEDQLDPCGRQGEPIADNPGHFAGGQALSPFFVPCDGTIGTSRRNMLRGPGLSQWDVTILKDTKIGERFTVQFRWEVFNVLNRGNFAAFVSNNTVGSGSFGKIKSSPDVAAGNPVIAQGGPRNMNFALKISF
jgi:hypothetical protein